MGLLLAVVVHSADIQDRDGAKLVINKLRERFPRLRLIWADGGYGGKLVDWVVATAGYVLEVVRGPMDQDHPDSVSEPKHDARISQCQGNVYGNNSRFEVRETTIYT